MKFYVKFTESNLKFSTKFAESNLKFNVPFNHFQHVSVEAFSYDGAYDVTPTTEPQTLKTKNKYLKDDVVVKSIPYSEIANVANGITVIIG